MGKSWDSSGIAYSVELWTQCLRVLKPGGHLLAFGGTRTWHRLAVAIEDAGFEIRDNIAWLYGSGFPKSHNISKAIDKKPEMQSTKDFKNWLQKQIDNSGKSKNQIDAECGFTACSYAKTDGKDGWSSNHPSKDKWAIIKKVIGLPDDWDWIITDNLAERGYIEPTGGLHGGTGNTVGKWEGGKQLSDNSISFDAKKWDGWGTALKPAHEPIVVARKPVIGTVAQNVLQHGVGALNIDATRIGFTSEQDRASATPQGRVTSNINAGAAPDVDDSGRREVDRPDNSSGRWPANIILDEHTAELLDKQSGVSKSKPEKIGAKGGSGFGFFDDEKTANTLGRWPADNGGGASRFFYVAKASKRDRNEGLDELQLGKAGAVYNQRPSGGLNAHLHGEDSKPAQNFHPTVKPTALMQYLIRLVTPDNGVVLDPFAGSGSTGKAAILEGKRFIGIELTAEYLPIIEGRLKHAYLTLDDKEDDLFE